MPRPRKSVPAYRLHKQSGQAIVTLNFNGTRRDVLLGKYGSPESQREYERVLAQLRADPTTPISGPGLTDLTVNELLLGFMNWADTHYRGPEGRPTTEVAEIRHSIAPLQQLFGPDPATEFGPRKLAAVRQTMIDRGWCRTLINRRIDRVKRAFKWAAAEEIVPVSVYQALRTLVGLQRGRTTTREKDPVRPVEPSHVTATIPFLSRHVRAMVELEQLTGMRPGEVCRLAFSEIDQTSEVWVYRPALHKSAHRGKGRAIPIGPKARAVLGDFLRGDHPPSPTTPDLDLKDARARRRLADAYQAAGRVADAALLRDATRPVVLVDGCVVDPAAAVFSPAREREERFRKRRARRKSKVPPSQACRQKPNPKRLPSQMYTTMAYAHAVRRAAERAGVPAWHPNQLRHAFASSVRRQYGLEAAQVILGHATADVTQVYAERDHALALRVAAEVG